MALKEEPYALPLKLDGKAFLKATVCSANTCILASYVDTPSIAWMSISPLVVDGEILVTAKYTGWSQKSPIRAEWPFAVALFKPPGLAKAPVLFVYHLAEASYSIHKVPLEAQAALMMGYERVAVVLKDTIQVLNCFDPTRNPLSLPAQVSQTIMPALCSSTSDSLVLTGFNTIQEWKITAKPPQARLSFQSHAEGFGFCEVVVYDNTIAAVSEGGAKLHFYDTSDPDGEEGRGTAEQEVQLTSPVAITKLFIDDDFIVTGLADGTMKLYDRDQRAFLAQLNIIPVAARGSAPTAEEGTAKPDSAYLQHKVSFLARQDDLMIATMLDPSGTIPPGELRQLEVSIWPIRGQNVVQPLKSKLLPGTVNFVHYDERNTRLLAITQYNRAAPHSANFGAAANSIANGGPLIGITWRPPFKSLMVSGIKWRETNDQLQAKLAQEVMEKVLLEPSFFRAMFLVDSDAEEIEQLVEAMFISLAARDNLHSQFVDAAITQEIVLRRAGNVQASNSSPALSRSTPLDSLVPEPKRTSNSISMSTSSIPKDSPSKEHVPSGAKAEAAAPPQYFPPHAMTTSVLTKCLAEHSYNYISSVLAKPLSIMIKHEVASLIFNLPSTQTTPEDQPMISSIIKVTTGIIDGLIEHQGKITPQLQRLLTSVHSAVCADNPSDSELRSFRRGAARVFLDYIVLTFWLDPVEYHLVNKMTDEVRHNLRVVAQLLQVICGYSKHKLVDPGLCSLVTEYSTKWRSWLLSRVSDRDGAKMKPGKDRKANLARGNSFVVAKSGNYKTAGLLVTKFIITHSQELLSIMNRASRSPDPCATRIRAISESLLMPIMSLMAKKGNKNTRLAASLNAFGRSGSMPTGSSTSSLHSSTSDSTTVSSESNEYGTGGRDESTESSEGLPREGSSEASPMRPRKKKRSRKDSSANSNSNPTGSTPNMQSTLLDSGSDGPVIVSDGASSNPSSESSGTLSRKASRSPRPKHKRRNSATRTVSKRISSGSLTSSTVEEFDEDILVLPSLNLTDKPRRIGIVGEVEAALPTEQFTAPSEPAGESSLPNMANSPSPTPEPSPAMKKRKPRKSPATPAPVSPASDTTA